MSLKELLAMKAEIEMEMEAVVAPLRDRMVVVQEQIDALIGPKLVELRALQGKDYGAINLNIDGIKVTETVTKKVEWNQDVLADIFGRITAAGDDPLAYMRAKYDVPEKQYGEFPKAIKNIFDEARVVKAGKPTIKFEDFNQ